MKESSENRARFAPFAHFCRCAKRKNIRYFLFYGDSHVRQIAAEIYEIFVNQIKCQKFDLENEGRRIEGQKRDLCHIRLKLVERLMVVFVCEYATSNRPADTQRKRQAIAIEAKSAKQICLKNAHTIRF